jgi:hypothetical protein
MHSTFGGPIGGVSVCRCTAGSVTPTRQVVQNCTVDRQDSRSALLSTSYELCRGQQSQQTRLTARETRARPTWQRLDANRVTTCIRTALSGRGRMSPPSFHGWSVPPTLGHWQCHADLGNITTAHSPQPSGPKRPVICLTCDTLLHKQLALLQWLAPPPRPPSADLT